LAVLEGPAARRWVFKATPAPLAAAECAAFELRQLGKRPCVPAQLFDYDMPELGVVGGVLKPFVEFDTDDELPTDTRAWTDLQRAVMLAEHAWEWWLADLDANAGQYALMGAERYPVKLDWDRAFSTLEPDPPSRFDRYKVILPNARGFLYVDWLEGKIDLELGWLCEEARHIARLPAERVRRRLLSYARHAELDADQTSRFVRTVLDRQRRAPREFERLASALRRERSSLSATDAHDLAVIVRAGGVRAWRLWQLVLDGLFRGPAGDVGRVALRAWRAHTARIQARGA
jgi:hypothetical protein